MRNKKLLLGIDIGTSIIKSTMLDLDGNELYSSTREAIVFHPKPSWAEQDMTLVWEAVVSTVSEIMEVLQLKPVDILALGITGQGDGTWLIDTNNCPIYPAILWSDGRAIDYVVSLEKDGLAKEIFNITGTAPNCSNQGLQLKWLVDHEPEIIHKAKAALRAKDWIFLCMTGIVSTDESDASHTYFDIVKREYDERILEIIGIRTLQRLIPPAFPSYQNVGKLLPDIANRIGILSGTPVVSGPFDVAASTLGMGIIQPGEASSILGTAGINQLVLQEPSFNPQYVGYNICHALSNRWIRLLPTMACTSNLEWFINEFFHNEITNWKNEGKNKWLMLENYASEIPIGSFGVMYHPYINPSGERSPFIHPGARAQFIGLNSNHNRKIMLRAVYEGIVLSALDCFSYLMPDVSSLKLGGGGSQSELLAQMFSDAFGCSISIMDGKEFGAKGAAINAGVAIGFFRDFPEAVNKMVHSSKIYFPDLNRTTIYKNLLSMYQKIYRIMIPVWDQRQYYSSNIYDRGFVQ